MSLSYQFLVSEEIIGKIVLQVAVTIWAILEPIVFDPLTEETWLRAASEFETMWNFPHCCGAIDGKHVYMHVSIPPPSVSYVVYLRTSQTTYTLLNYIPQAPPHSGTRFRNYKHRFSLILMAIADAKRKFLVVDVGSSGRRGDGNVYHSSVFGKMFEKKLVNLPPPCPVEGIEGNVPFVLLGDGAFERSENLVNSFQKKKKEGVLCAPERLFNTRFSGARHVVEDAFGILYERYAIFQRVFQASRSIVKWSTLACCALHNFHLSDERSAPPKWRRDHPQLYHHTIDEDGKIWLGRYKNENPAAEREALLRLCENVEVAKTAGNEEEENMVGEDIREALLDYFIKNPAPGQCKKACVG